VEHIAAINGDCILLLWLLKKELSYARSPELRDQARRCVTLPEGDHWGLPRDVGGNTPLHYMSSAGNDKLIDCYTDIGIHERNRMFNYINDFNAVNSKGKTAFDLAKDSSTAESLRALEKQLYQGVLTKAISDERSEIDYTELQRLIQEYDLDVELAMSGEFHRSIDSRVAVFSAIEQGNLSKLQWFIETMKLADISLKNDEGLTLLHIAARTDVTTRGEMAERIRLVNNENSFWHKHRCEELQSKRLFLEYHWKDKADLISEMEGSLIFGLHRGWDMDIDQYKKHCEGTKETAGRLKIIQWLIRKGLLLPEIDYILNECEFPTAQLLLEYRMAADTRIDNSLMYSAPIAMEAIKEYLYRTPIEALQTPSKMIFALLGKPQNDPLGDTEAKTLLLLKWLLDNCGVDPTELRTECGETMLHEAVRNGQTVLAIWLAATYHMLTRVIGDTSGKMPVHISLELAPSNDKRASGSLAHFMIMYAGEGRDRDGWTKDERAWNLTDRDGRTVRDYAKCCKDKQIWYQAWKPDWNSNFALMIDMLGDGESTVDQFDIHCKEHFMHEFIEFLSDNVEEIRFMYAAISHGRLDVLRWYETTFYQKNTESRYNGLAKKLEGATEERSKKEKLHCNRDWDNYKRFPRVFCNHAVGIVVSDKLEILSSFSDPMVSFPGNGGREYSSRILDGTWLLSGWKPWSEYKCSVCIDNFKVFSDEPGMNPAAFDVTQDGTFVLRANDGEEIWYSINVPNAEGLVNMILFKRYNRREDIGLQFWVENDRTICLTKLRPLEPDTSSAKHWRVAKVIEANAENLRITFATDHPSGSGLDSSFDEWIPRDSERINTSGRIRLEYFTDWVTHSPPETALEIVMSGRELATRCGHSNVVDWIDAAMAPLRLREELDQCNVNFLNAVFGDASAPDLEEILNETKAIVAAAETYPSLETVVFDSQDKAYVLQKCWESQPALRFHLPGGISSHHPLYHDIKTLGLFRCMARLGRLDRIKWMIKTGKIRTDSEYALGALFDAAYIDNVGIVEELIASGVDYSQRFAIHAHNKAKDDDDILSIYTKETSLIEFAISELCGEVACFLLSGNCVPQRQLNNELVSSTVAYCSLWGNEKEERAAEKANNRLGILKTLLAQGLDLYPNRNNKNYVLVEALRRLAVNQNDSDKDINVPTTRALVEFLCSEGCDLVSAVAESFGYKFPQWLEDMVARAKSTWPLCDAISNKESTDELELLLDASSTNVCDARDRKGRTLLHLATVTGHIECLEWLVKKKGVDIDERDSTTNKTAFQLAQELGMKEVMQKIQWLQKWAKANKKKIKALQRKMDKAVIRIQTIARCFIAQKKIKQMRELQSFGVWSKVALEVSRLELGVEDRPHYFGKSWVQLKVETDLVVQEQLDLLDSSSLASEEDDAWPEDLNNDTDELQETPRAGPATSKGTEPKAQGVNSIQLTSDALKWVRTVKDEKYREMFAKRLGQLAQGDRSYCLRKTLKGSSRVVTETKLDSGQRIIWTQRGKDILIWFICKHKHINRCLNLVDISYERVISSNTGKQDLEGQDVKGITAGVGVSIRQASANTSVSATDPVEPEIFVNPTANVPLKIHSIYVSELDRLVSDENWTPPFKLTSQEEDIVNREGTVLLLGRAGTGKTYCVCNRMARDRKRYGKNLRQLFVAKTGRLCGLVKALQEGAGEDVSTSRFVKITSLIEDLSNTMDKSTGKNIWLANKLVSYETFRDRIWENIRGKEKELDALHVWTQIRSFIKGSFEAAQSHRPLEESFYVGQLSKDRCRLDRDQRQRAYGIFERYQVYADKHGLWDDMDRVTHVLEALQSEQSKKGAYMYNRVYVDEVQDFTQAEIGLLFHLTGAHDTLFLVGDTAQAVSHGVDFRFEEVRSIVHAMSLGKDRIGKWEKLCRNFRSHEGILRVANLVLDRLYNAFPSAAAKLPPDTGLVHGPRPSLLLLENDFTTVADLISANERLRVLVRDEYKDTIKENLSLIRIETKEAVFGIREAKGLEFSDVVILDFFASITDQTEHHKEWKRLLLWSDKSKTRDTAYVPVTMELEIKLLYTAITRSCNRLIFIETRQSQGFDAWCRCLQGRNLAQMVQASTMNESGSKSAIMTPDEWSVEGLEMASLAEDETAEASVGLLERAISHFHMAGAASHYLEIRAEAQIRAIQLEQDAQRHDSSVEGEPSPEAVIDAIGATLAYLEAGMLTDSSRVCTAYDMDHNLATLRKRIMRLTSDNSRHETNRTDLGSALAVDEVET